MRQVLSSKIHRAVVTETNLNYVGSITIDAELLKAANIIEYEKVLVVNINTGARVETYCIEGKSNSGDICLNGGAARMFLPGDKVVIMSFRLVPDNDYCDNPTIILVGENNQIINIDSKEKSKQIYETI